MILTASSGYNTAHAIKVFPKFFPAPQMVRVRFLVSHYSQISPWSAKITGVSRSSSVPTTPCWTNIINMSHSKTIKRTWGRSWDIPWQGLKDHEYSFSHHLQSASICSKPSKTRGEVERRVTPNDMRMHVVKSPTLSTSQSWTYGRRLWGSRDGMTDRRFQVLRIFPETST